MTVWCVKLEFKIIMCPFLKQPLMLLIWNFQKYFSIHLFSSFPSFIFLMACNLRKISSLKGLSLCDWVNYVFNDMVVGLRFTQFRLGDLNEVILTIWFVSFFILLSIFEIPSFFLIFSRLSRVVPWSLTRKYSHQLLTILTFDGCLNKLWFSSSGN
jgi:hypothetical protein